MRPATAAALSAAAALSLAHAANAQVTAEFVQVQDDVFLIDNTGANVLGDVYEFQVTNNSGEGLFAFELDFVGDFLNGSQTTSIDNNLFSFSGLTFADTFFAGSGTSTPDGFLFTDNGQQLAGVIGYPSPGQLPSNTTRAVAVFSTLANAQPLGPQNVVTAVTVVDGQLFTILDGSGSPPDPDPTPDPIGEPTPMTGTVTGEFVLAQQNTTAIDPSTGLPTQIDVYEFVLANGTLNDLTALDDTAFSGDFINGGVFALASSELPEANGQTLAETFFAGNGELSPTSPGPLTDNSSILSADAIIIGGADDPWVPSGRRLPIAVLSVPAGSPPLTFQNNFNSTGAFLRGTGIITPIVAVPEPASAALLALAVPALLRRRR